MTIETAQLGPQSRRNSIKICAVVLWAEIIIAHGITLGESAGDRSGVLTVNWNGSRWSIRDHRKWLDDYCRASRGRIVGRAYFSGGHLTNLRLLPKGSQLGKQSRGHNASLGSPVAFDSQLSRGAGPSQCFNFLGSKSDWIKWAYGANARHYSFDSHPLIGAGSWTAAAAHGEQNSDGDWNNGNKFKHGNPQKKWD